MTEHARWTILLVLAALLGTAARPCAAREALRTPTSPGDFEKLLTALKSEAETFANSGGDEEPKPSPVVAKVQYSMNSVNGLVRALSTRHGKGLVDLYVYYQLLQPLNMAGNDLLRRLRPTLAGLLLHRCVYQPMKRWPRSTLVALNPPANLPEQKLMKLMEKLQKLRREKKVAEEIIVKHNRTVAALEATLKKLLVMMADPAADEVLLKKLWAEQTQGSLRYEQTLSVIKAEAVHMNPKTAKYYYDSIKAMAYRAGVKKRYTDPTRPRYSITANSSFYHEQRYFAVAALKVVNVLASSARQPAVKIPDVEAYERNRRRRH